MADSGFQDFESQAPPAEVLHRWVLLGSIGVFGGLILYGALLEPLARDPLLAYAAAGFMAVWLELIADLGVFTQGRRPRWPGVVAGLSFVAYAVEILRGPDENGRYWEPQLMILALTLAFFWDLERRYAKRGGEDSRQVAAQLESATDGAPPALGTTREEQARRG